MRFCCSVKGSDGAGAGLLLPPPPPPLRQPLRMRALITVPRETALFTPDIIILLTPYYFCHAQQADSRYGERFRSEEHTSELQSRPHLVCRLLLEKKKK